MSSKRDAGRHVYSFQDYKCTPDPIFALEAECHEKPIVVDNGSYQCRAGWACGESRFEEPLLVFRSAAARSRGAARSESHVGNDISNLEPLRWTLKSAFDRNALVNCDIQELVFDYIFTHLGINTQGHVGHPVVVTEPPCNPLHCRQMMSELLFECYGVPQVTYGVDSLFSFYNNNITHGLDPPHTGLVLSSGYHCSHVLPVINGRLDAVNCKRVNVGGGPSAAYLQRLLQLKYPAHQNAITLSRMEELLHQHSYIALDYHSELEKWRRVEFYEQEVHRVQLAFSGRVTGVCEERSERKAQQLKRLQEINNRRREEKLHEDQKRLQTLLAVQELLEDGSRELFHRSLMELNMDSAEELQSYIHKLSVSVEQHKITLKTELSEMESALDEGNVVDSDVTEESSVVQPLFNVAEYHQLFVGTERVRAPEILFQPSLMGEEQMGLMETLQFVLEQYPPDLQGALVKNVFLTGGNLQYSGVRERVQRELLAIRPFQSHFQVSQADAGALDSWFGAREWALRNPSGGPGWISRQDYEEKGGEYLSEHCASNVFIPIELKNTSPAPKLTLVGKYTNLPDTANSDNVSIP
ncbi:actin-related protein 5 [Triplophysa rosa]|uniref:Actin-related protein 5 n=1 Tax=Triplophysa rosa TaxID=992332 RepID=A0A9W7WUF0_TRIRA|nr:actin-related protein 5 [Triplophysa rosa]KAI7808445.1 actin-related protein 5 [Triplophysa rosa]